MTRNRRGASVFAALGASISLLVAGCGGGASGGSGDGDVTMSFWHNSTTGEGAAY